MLRSKNIFFKRAALCAVLINDEIGKLGKDVGILQGSWKTYLAIGGIAGTLGAVVGALIK